jgi:hypothetical protein
VLIRRLSAAAAALGLFGIAAPVSGASAATSPPSIAQAPGSGLLTFVPPSVGPISVSIGPTIIGGKMINSGVNVSLPGISLPPITWTLPSSSTFPINGAPVH